MKPNLLIKIGLLLLWVALLAVTVFVFAVWLLLSLALWLRDRAEGLVDAINGVELWLEDKWRGGRP